MADDFTWHANALKGTRGPVHVDDPQSGWYENRRKDKQTGKVTRNLVAFWKDSNDGSQRKHLNGRDARDEDGMLWAFSSKYPIPAEVYYNVLGGAPWPDAAASVAAADAEEIPADQTLDDATAKIIADIEAAKLDAKNYAKIESDDVLIQSQSLRSSLTSLAGKLDKEREALVRPHLDEQQRINAKYNPIIKSAKDTAVAIRTAQEAWEDDKREIARVAQAAAEKAERERLAAIQKAADEGRPLPSLLPPDPPKSNAPAPLTQIKGSSGRAANVKTVDAVISIDEDAVFAQFKGNADLTALLIKLAQTAIDAGIKVPGATTKEKAQIR